MVGWLDGKDIMCVVGVKAGHGWMVGWQGCHVCGEGQGRTLMDGWVCARMSCVWWSQGRAWMDGWQGYRVRGGRDVNKMKLQSLCLHF